MQVKSINKAKIVLLVLLLIETIGLSISVVFFISRIFFESVSSSNTFVAVSVLLALITLWVGWSLTMIWKGKNSAQSSILTWQILQIPISFSLLQGGIALSLIGFAGFLLSVLTIAALYLSRATYQSKGLVR